MPPLSNKKPRAPISLLIWSGCHCRLIYVWFRSYLQPHRPTRTLSSLPLQPSCQLQGIGDNKGAHCNPIASTLHFNVWGSLSIYTTITHMCPASCILYTTKRKHTHTLHTHTHTQMKDFTATCNVYPQPHLNNKNCIMHPSRLSTLHVMWVMNFIWIIRTVSSCTHQGFQLCM